MDTFSLLGHGLAVALQPENLIFAVLGCFIGSLIGALPGLGPSNGVALLIPLSFALGLGADTSMILMTSVYAGAMYGGRISSILLNIPGDEPAMMTCLDGYPMAQQGKASEALALSAVASFIGSLIAIMGLVLFAPLLASVALTFGPAEYFALFVLAFATLGGVAGNDPAKAAIASLLGLGLSTIGLDLDTGVERFTFHHLKLHEGIDFLVVIVGLFAISELLTFVEKQLHGEQRVPVSKLRINLKDIAYATPTMLRCSVVGFVAGVLPGSGASLGSFVAYTWERMLAGPKSLFGKGDPRGVAAPEAANNAAATGALVPMLTLGVPGSGTTAVLLALLVTMNVTPGPLMMTQHADVFWGVAAAIFLGNFVLLLLNIPLVGLFVKLLSIPTAYLMPVVTTIAFVGVYSISNSSFDLMLMVGIGVAGWLLRKLGVPLVPVILGLLLGPSVEKNFRHTLQLSGGDWGAFLGSPVAIGLWVATLACIVIPLVLHLRRRATPSIAADGD